MPTQADEKVKKKSQSTRTKNAGSSAAPTNKSPKKAVRKAPVRSEVAKQKETGFFSTKLITVSAIGVVVIAGVSVFIGLSDKGQLSVSQIIEKRAIAQEKTGDREGSAATRAIKASAAARTDQPNGGLVGQGNRDTQQQALESSRENEVSSTTASTTDQSASSTDSEAVDTEQEEHTDDTVEENQTVQEDSQQE